MCVCCEYSKIEYISIDNVFDLVREAGPGATIIKKDIADAFRNIPVAPLSRWLLGFEWQGTYYEETCLPFGLSTAPLLFNLFAKGFH